MHIKSVNPDATGFRGTFWSSHPFFSWIICNGTKEGRTYCISIDSSAYFPAVLFWFYSVYDSRTYTIYHYNLNTIELFLFWPRIFCISFYELHSFFSQIDKQSPSTGTRAWIILYASHSCLIRYPFDHSYCNIHLFYTPDYLFMWDSIQFTDVDTHHW